MRNQFMAVLAATLLTGALQAQDSGLHERANAIFDPLPETMPGAEQDSRAKVALGRDLYFEEALSVNATQSCNTCHRLDQGRAGDDGRPVSPGAVEGREGNRNAPTVINAGLHVDQFWDGRADDLKEQAQGPILNPEEMALPSAEAAEENIREAGDYKARFNDVYDQGVTFDNIAEAIAAFERTLISEDRFDAWLEGDRDALTKKEKRGLKTFMDTGCTSCHSGALLGGDSYRKMGMVEPYADTDDKGRMKVTGKESDKFVFKVPSLRNVALTAPYFHDGGVASLDQAVRKMASLQLGRDLTDKQVRDIVAFLETLNKKDDENFAQR
jgi:cytochrome c peroxidase